MKLQFRALSEVDDHEIQSALRENFEAFVEFVADTLEEGKARGIVKPDVDSRMIAWQFLGIGMTLDLMHMLGFKDEMDSARADLWGRVYLRRSVATTRPRPLRKRRDPPGAGAGRRAMRSEKRDVGSAITSSRRWPVYLDVNVRLDEDRAARRR